MFACVNRVDGLRMERWDDECEQERETFYDSFFPALPHFLTPFLLFQVCVWVCGFLSIEKKIETMSRCVFSHSP